jgi:hypothetical protein
LSFDTSALYRQSLLFDLSFRPEVTALDGGDEVLPLEIDSTDSVSQHLLGGFF